MYRLLLKMMGELLYIRKQYYTELCSKLFSKKVNIFAFKSKIIEGTTLSYNIALLPPIFKSF